MQPPSSITSRRSSSGSTSRRKVSRSGGSEIGKGDLRRGLRMGTLRLRGDFLNDPLRQWKARAALGIVDAALGHRIVTAARAGIGVQLLQRLRASIRRHLREIDAGNLRRLRVFELGRLGAIDLLDRRV